jgi:protein-S-isoprenylcysteine O-methyltransferase Ste14
MADRWFAAGCAGLAGFLVLEAGTRSRGAASSLEATPEDRRTTAAVSAAYAAAGTLVPVLARLPGPRLPASIARSGLALEAGGLALRAWSMRTLGGAYSRTLRVADEQRVVESGPYRVVRHPGYLGSLATWSGFAMTSRSPLALVAAAALLGGAYRRRIEAEEALLARKLPGYEAYSQRGRRLLPGIW